MTGNVVYASKLGSRVTHKDLQMPLGHGSKAVTPDHVRSSCLM